MSTSAEGPETTALQVMSPNAAAGHEGTSQPAEVNRGSNGSLPNGVASREFLLSTSDSRPGAGDVIPSTVDEFLVGREAGMGHEAQELTEVNSVAVAQGSLPGQSTSGGQASVAATMALQDGSVHAVRANMEVQQGSSSLTVVRWISRLNDFLANQGQSVLGSVGFNTTPTQGPRHSRTTQQAITPAATPSRGQQQQAAAAAARSRSTQGSPLGFSPPEELPHGGGWTPQPEYPQHHEAPLFSREAWEQMMRFSQRAPWLCGRGGFSQEDSTGSSEVQAEVQRQMEATMRTQSRQMEEMREEIQYLRAESGAG